LGSGGDHQSGSEQTERNFTEFFKFDKKKELPDLYAITVETSGRTYRWFMGIVRRKENIKEKKIIMIRCSSCPNNASPQKIHPFLKNSYMNTICIVETKHAYTRQNIPHHLLRNMDLLHLMLRN